MRDYRQEMFEDAQESYEIKSKMETIERLMGLISRDVGNTINEQKEEISRKESDIDQWKFQNEKLMKLVSSDVKNNLNNEDYRKDILEKVREEYEVIEFVELWGMNGSQEEEDLNNKLQKKFEKIIDIINKKIEKNEKELGFLSNIQDVTEDVTIRLQRRQDLLTFYNSKLDEVKNLEKSLIEKINIEKKPILEFTEKYKNAKEDNQILFFCLEQEKPRTAAIFKKGNDDVQKDNKFAIC